MYHTCLCHTLLCVTVQLSIIHKVQCSAIILLLSTSATIRVTCLTLYITPNSTQIPHSVSQNLITMLPHYHKVFNIRKNYYGWAWSQQEDRGNNSSKKQMRRRQASSVIESASLALPPSQGGDNPVMELFMDLYSHISSTEEFIATRRESEIMYPPVRSVHWGSGWFTAWLAECNTGAAS